MLESGEVTEETVEHSDGSESIVYQYAPRAEVDGVSIFDRSRALDRAIVMVQELIEEHEEDPTSELDDLKKVRYALKQVQENKEEMLAHFADALHTPEQKQTGVSHATCIRVYLTQNNKWQAVILDELGMEVWRDTEEHSYAVRAFNSAYVELK